MQPQIYVLLSCFIAWLIAQITKIVYNKLKFNLEGIMAAGRLPSSHSASAAALTTAVFLVDQFSLLFTITLVFSIVILRDALFRHKPLDILIGILIGIITSSIIFYII